MKVKDVNLKLPPISPSASCWEVYETLVGVDPSFLFLILEKIGTWNRLFLDHIFVLIIFDCLIDN